jgi:hypothetical protein
MELAGEASLWDRAEGIETEIGGALYLLNVVSRMDLPDCFDDQCELSQYLTSWGVIELIARALLAQGNLRFDYDPLWELLKRLDGRVDGDRTGRDFPGRRSYRLPAGWLAAFASEKEHRNKSFAPPEIEKSRDPYWSAVSPPLRKWFAQVFPFVRSALALAVGEETNDRESLARLVLLKRARVYSTATHVDMVMSLDQIEPAVRRAGLDLNPGWLPGLMRVVSFHYN